MEQLLLDLAHVPTPTLDNFAPGQNVEALAALRSWLAGSLAERCLYLWGPAGSGKTHLLVAAEQALRDTGRAFQRVGGAEIEDAERAGIRASTILIDDVQQFSDPAQAALFRLYQRLPEENARLLVTGDCAPAGLPLRADVSSRLAAGLVFQLRLLSDEDKIAALASHAAECGFALTPELADYLLVHGRRDLPSLLSVLSALDRHSLTTKRPITLTLLREVMQQAQVS